MASSLDEQQPYDLLQVEMDAHIELFVKQVDKKQMPECGFVLNRLVEYVCFNRFLVSAKAIDDELILQFVQWLSDITDHPLDGKSIGLIAHRFVRSFLESQKKSR